VSDLANKVAELLNAPVDLVQRSAEARAQASGNSTEEILSSWAGEESVTPSEAPVQTQEAPTAESTPQEENSVQTTSQEEEIIEDAPEVETEVTTVVTQTIQEDVAPPVPMYEKIFKSLKYGLSFGILSGLVQGLLASSYLYDGLILEAETQKLISEYNRISFLFIITATTSLFSIINSLNIKKFLESNFEGYGIHTSDRESIFTGLGLGLIFGSITSFYVINSVGQTIEGILPEDPVINLISVGGAFWRIVILSAVTQSLVSMLSMLLGIPKGLEEFEMSETKKIRDRVVGSLLIPVVSIIVGGIIAFAIAQVFLNFHEYAPLFALIISSAILIFASVMSSAPKIKITRTEVLIASSGVLVLIIIIASVAASQH
jgi:hypothetical protein